MSWADVVEDETEQISTQSRRSDASEPRLEVLSSIQRLEFLFERRIENFIFIDLDSLKKGAGKHTYKFIADGTLPNTLAVLLFRRAPPEVGKTQEGLSKTQLRKQKGAGTAHNRIRVQCASCKNTLSIKPHLGGTRFLIESPHDQAGGTRYLLGFYVSHFAARLKKLSRNTPLFVLSPEQGAAETIDLVKKHNPDQVINQITLEDLTSFTTIPSWGGPVVVTPPRESFSDQLPGELGIDTARKRALKYFNDTKQLPTTKAALEKALTPLCRLRGDVDSHLIVDMLRQRKVWAQCDEVCGTFYYPKKKDGVTDAAAKPKTVKHELHRDAERIDPHLASGAKVVTSALAVLPPEDEWDPIQEVRSKHDKAYERWPPHINLMFPFVPASRFEEIRPKMEAALRDFGPIRITLSSFSHFSHSKTSKTLYCEVDAEAKAALTKLYARLEQQFPFCVNPGHDGFHPHLTLGQFNSDAAVQKFVAELSKDWEPIQFTLSHVSCLAREKDTRFETKMTYSFPGTEGQLPSETNNPDSPEEQVYRRVVSELMALNPVHRPQSVADLGAFVRKLTPNTEVPLADLMTLLTERDIITLKRDLAIEDRLTPVIVNRNALKRLLAPASEKLILEPIGDSSAPPEPSKPAPASSAASSAASFDSNALFVKSAVYSGQKPGYAFKMGPQGLGYYRDGK